MTGGAGPFTARVLRFRRDEGGATAIEYALIAGLIFLAIVTGVQTYASRMDTMYRLIGTTIASER